MATTAMSVPHIKPRSDNEATWRAIVELWARRHRTRAVLRDLALHELADIGLDEGQRRAECAKPFWKA